MSMPQSLESVNILSFITKERFADIINIKDLKMGRLLWILADSI